MTPARRWGDTCQSGTEALWDPSWSVLETECVTMSRYWKDDSFFSWIGSFQDIIITLFSPEFWKHDDVAAKTSNKHKFVINVRGSRVNMWFAAQRRSRDILVLCFCRCFDISSLTSWRTNIGVVTSGTSCEGPLEGLRSHEVISCASVSYI